MGLFCSKALIIDQFTNLYVTLMDKAEVGNRYMLFLIQELQRGEQPVREVCSGPLWQRGGKIKEQV